MRTDSMIVMTDVHGCYNTMMALIEQFPKDVPYCIAGDLVDRGPRNRKVIDHARKYNIPVAVGNHELLMDPPDTRWSQCWIMNGGRATLKEYETIPVYEEVVAERMGFQEYKTDIDALESDRQWIKSLPLYLEFKDIKREDGRHLVVSHTSLSEFWDKKDDPGIKMDAVWWRKSMPKDIKGVFNIFGHTPQAKPLVRDHFANIDTGCVYNGSFNMSTLTALQFPEMIFYTQENIDGLISEPHSKKRKRANSKDCTVPESAQFRFLP